MTDIAGQCETLSGSLRPRKRPDLREQELNDGCVLYDTKGGTVCTLNVAAAFFLAHCNGEYTLEQMAQEFAATVGISREKAMEDAFLTVKLFQEKGLLESA